MSDEDRIDGQAFVESLHEAIARVNDATGFGRGDMVLKLGSGALAGLAGWFRAHRGGVVSMLIDGGSDLDVVRAFSPVRVELDPDIDANAFFGPGCTKLDVPPEADPHCLMHGVGVTE